MSNFDLEMMRRAISLARRARDKGNLPIGAVLCLDQKVIAEGRNSIWQPQKNLTRHAEIETFREVPSDLWERAAEMCLYSTLEPCVMCFGASVLHGIGRIVFGASDPWAGASTIFDHLPSLLAKQLKNTKWIGPFMPEECDGLYQEAVALAREHSEDPIHSHCLVDE